MLSRKLAHWVELFGHLSTCRRYFEREPCICIEAGSIPAHFVVKSGDFRRKSFFLWKW